jgi:hypothetical protein
VADDAPIRFAVRDLTDDLSDRMDGLRQRYLRQSTRLDESYVHRFLEYEPPQEQTPESLQGRLMRIAERRARLERLSLLGAERATQTADVSGISDDKRLALSLYADDMDKKLSVLEPLANQLDTLLERANRKLRNKQLVLDPGDGLLVETTYGKPQQLDLEQLSSGEGVDPILT